LGSAPNPDTIHDFWGFPPELDALSYPAPGGPELAREAARAIESAGLPVRLDPARGLDHGAWVPLSLMFPQADLPVIPLSIQGSAGPHWAWRLGLALAPLAAQGLLVVGSGNLTHNLGDWREVARAGGASPAYVRGFADWVHDRLAEGDLQALLDYRRRTPLGTRAHPTEEHLLPLFLALGAAGPGARAERFHTGIDESVLAMDAWAFAPEAAGGDRAG
jgi:4,5-DOPA dioxygenase extradiol